MNCKSTYLEKSLLKWTVIFALFLSLFTFSYTYNNSIALKTSPVFQTEWVYEWRRSFTAPTRFRKTLRNAAISFKKYSLQAFAFNQLVKAKLTKIIQISISISTTTRFFVQEATVQYPTEIDCLNYSGF